MLRTIRKLIKNEAGATAIEYGLIAALVSVAAITALTEMGGSLNQMFGTVSTKLQDAVSGGTGGGTP
jgi:pilus assembly protein Flp/PilA